MKRLTIFLTFVLAFYGIGLTASSAIAIDGPLANATVSFGEWRSDFEPPLDRIVADPTGGAGNKHELIPQIATIKEGGSVNFIISGGHVVAVYDDGTQPEDINITNIETNPGCPANNPTQAGGVLSDSNRRIYRGPCHTSSPFTTATPRRDGVEVVQFTKPGTYLVICARKNHFAIPNTVPQQFEMYGFVKVLPGK